MFCLQPNEVETARGESPRGANSAANEEQSEMRGRSSATTTRVRTQPSWMPRDRSWDTEPPRPLVHSSITPGRMLTFITGPSGYVIVLT
jgi:hypothetical protein